MDTAELDSALALILAKPLATKDEVFAVLRARHGEKWLLANAAFLEEEWTYANWLFDRTA